jgi:hypothetical protein
MRKLELVTCMGCETVRPMAVAAREGWSLVYEGDVQVGTRCPACQTPEERTASKEATRAVPLAEDPSDPLPGMVREEFVAAMGRVAPGTDVVDRDDLIRGMALSVAARIPYGDPIRGGQPGTAFLARLMDMANDHISGSVRS